VMLNSNDSCCQVQGSWGVVNVLITPVQTRMLFLKCCSF
jgi:hypothetical protein